MRRPFALVLTAGALVWVSAIVIVPAALQHAAFADVSTAVYTASASFCHQRLDRTFWVAGSPMPVCARCAGLYVAGAVGVLLGWAPFARTGVAHSRRWLIAAAVPTAVTWTLEAAGLATFSNAARAAAALPLGAVAGWVFVGMLRYDAPLDAHEIHDSGTRAGRA